ncbi:hypothetical protein [Amnibacterium soli]
MSDITDDEAADIGAADPITGVAAGGDDLARDTVLPDSGVEDGDDEAEEDGGESADYARGDWATIQAESNSTVTNDAVAGETVYAGEGDGNDGPTGGAPAETRPDEPDNGIDPDSIDLEDER